MRDDLIEIKSIVESVNSSGDVIEETSSRTIFATIKSVRMSEFYQGMGVGFKPEIVFEVYANEINLDNDKYVIYDGKEYEIIRSYMCSLDKIELTCIRKVRN